KYAEGLVPAGRSSPVKYLVVPLPPICILKMSEALTADRKKVYVASELAATLKSTLGLIQKLTEKFRTPKLLYVG
ncbi:hypothetical protein COV22_03740, partial [Candidatus Woesearchaeota archaeon CG10_big_fil_rev_8_21_14_0_10_47_5]